MAKNKKPIRNVRNPESSLYRRLTRLFSGPLVNYKRQTERNLKRRKLIKYPIKSITGKEFKKSPYYPFQNLQAERIANQSRIERYGDFDQMEYSPILASALDIYAEEMTTSNKLDRLLDIRCPNAEIKEVLRTLFYDVLNIEFNLFGWARTMCKYGDSFLYLDIDPTTGIKNIIGLPSSEVERLEGEDPDNPNYIQYQWNAAGLTFENWQMAHFRILGNDKFAPYGSSVLDPARRIWRQLTLLEDAMMAYRITRAPERRAFYIDVGNIAPDDVATYIQQVQTEMKRNQVVDPTTGRVDLRYNPLSVDEDFYIPIRGQNSSRIESLPGGQYTGDIDDVKYLKNKLFSAIKIPQSYLDRGEGADEDKATLAQKDIRFARTIQRLQKSVISELSRMGTVHLYILGFRGEDLLSFDLALNNPSKLAELQELEHWRTKFDVASSAVDGHFSRRWLAKKLFNLSDEEIQQNYREMFYDRELDAKLGAVEEGGAGADTSLPGEDFGDEDLGDEGDMGADGDMGDAGAEDTAEDETLLAAPAKRDDDAYTTPGAKGKFYAPVNTDKRGMGARQRSLAAKYSIETAGSSKRNLFKGHSDLSTLGRGISENKETTYDKDEEKVLDTHHEIKKMFESLDLIERQEDVKTIKGKPALKLKPLSQIKKERELKTLVEKKEREEKDETSS